jgi:uncharacterized membrane protein YbhN (UPF0104 family)
MDGLPRRRLQRGAMRLGLAAAVAALVIVALPDLAGVRHRLGSAAGGWVATGAGLEAAAVVAFAVAFHRMFRADLAWRDSASLATTSQGINVLVPAGGTGGLAAMGVVMVRLGLSRDYVISRMVAVFAVVEAATNVAMVILGGFGVAGGLLPGHASWEFTLVPGVLATALCVALVIVSRRSPAERSAATSRRRRAIAAVTDPLRAGLRASGAVLRAGDPLLLLGAVAFIGLDLAALAASFAAVHSPGLPLGTLLLAYPLGQIGSVIPLPGTTEGGLLGVLVLYGAPVGQAASAIVIFRAIEIFIPLALGLVGAIGVRRMLSSGLSPPEGPLVLPAPSGPR